MKYLVKFSSTLVTASLIFGSSQLLSQAGSLAGLLDLVENDRVAESDEYQARLNEFEQNAARQQEILDTTNTRITDQEQLQVQLSFVSSTECECLSPKNTPEVVTVSFTLNGEDFVTSSSGFPYSLLCAASSAAG